MINKELLHDLCSLSGDYKDNERCSEILPNVPSGKYLCIRLDGIGLSKRYLKDSIFNGGFRENMRKSWHSTYDVLHRKSPTDAQNIFLCAMICSDEISIILNSQKNYYDGRIMKIVTTIASTYSSFFTGHGLSINPKKKRLSGSFDGRPLIFTDTNEASDYLKCRYSLYVRNTLSKILRLNGVSSEELYSDQNNNNIVYYLEKIHSLGLELEMERIMAQSIFFLPDESNELKPHKFESLEDINKNINNLIYSFDTWINEKCA